MSDIKKPKPQNSPVTDNTWQKLNEFTDARIGLGRAGISIPTKHLLAFQLAHAKAQDAVHTALNVTELAEQIKSATWSNGDEPILLHSQAVDRATYLQRPDEGRLLDKNSAKTLDRYSNQNASEYDLVIAVVDGLSALAISENTIPFLDALFETPLLHFPPSSNTEHSNLPLNIAPICIIEQGRVAIGDDICERLNAKCVLVLVGERPGLSSPNSLGLYLTWSAKVGCTDADRNCISNVRQAGLTYQEAAIKARYLIHESKRRQLTGVQLKDRSTMKSDEKIDRKQQNFLIN